MTAFLTYSAEQTLGVKPPISLSDSGSRGILLMTEFHLCLSYPVISQWLLREAGYLERFPCCSRYR